jgi:hypothetical protein
MSNPFGRSAREYASYFIGAFLRYRSLTPTSEDAATLATEIRTEMRGMDAVGGIPLGQCRTERDSLRVEKVV